jgi:MYXO-CTERM domain-containing protein
MHRTCWVVGGLAVVASAAACSKGSHSEDALAAPTPGVARDTPALERRASGPVAPHRVRRPHPVVRSGHRVVRNLESFLAHANDDAGDVDANTPFGDFWWFGASSSDTSAIPNSGVQMEANVIAKTPPEAANGCVSVWTSDILSNDMWGQIGYSVCDIPGDTTVNFTSFFQVWDLSVGPDGTLLVDQESSDITPGLHSFAMYVQSGTTWAYAVDGNVMGVCDMGSATGNAPYGVTTLLEEGDGVATAFTPPGIALPIAMEVLNAGKWGPAATALAVDTADIAGVAGQLQDPQLADDQMIIGGSSPTPDGSAPLWNGTAIGGGLSTASDAGVLSEPYVAVACPVANATIGGTVAMPITATAPGGIASVTVYVDGVTDVDGGSARQPCTFTTPQTSPFVCEWNTADESDGQYYLSVVATAADSTFTYETLVINVSQAASSPCPALLDAGPTDAGGADATPSRDAGSDAGGGPTEDAGGADAAPGADSGAPGETSDAAGGGADASLGLDAGTGNGHSSGGCGCRAVGGDASAARSHAALALLGMILLGRRRRRKGSGARAGEGQERGRAG